LDTVTENITLYASWIMDTFSIDFDSNGGTSIVHIVAEYNSTIAEPITPTKLGYTFATWYSDSDLTTIWNFESDTVTKDMILYAKWDEQKISGCNSINPKNNAINILLTFAVLMFFTLKFKK